MKGYCKSCKGIVDETEQTNGYCLNCHDDILVYPILFSDLDIGSKDILMNKVCERIIALEKVDKRSHENGVLKEAYVIASGILDEVHFKQEKIQQEQNVIEQMLNDVKSLFQKGWGVPK